MLVLAPAAMSVVAAEGVHAGRGGLQNASRSRMHHALLTPNFLHFGALTGQNARGQNRPPGREAQRLAPVDQFDRRKFENRRHSEPPRTQYSVFSIQYALQPFRKAERQSRWT